MQNLMSSKSTQLIGMAIITLILGVALGKTIFGTDNTADTSVLDVDSTAAEKSPQRTDDTGVVNEVPESSDPSVDTAIGRPDATVVYNNAFLGVELNYLAEWGDPLFEPEVDESVNPPRYKSVVTMGRFSDSAGIQMALVPSNSVTGDVVGTQTAWRGFTGSEGTYELMYGCADGECKQTPAGQTQSVDTTNGKALVVTGDDGLVTVVVNLVQSDQFSSFVLVADDASMLQQLIDLVRSFTENPAQGLI